MINSALHLGIWSYIKCISTKIWSRCWKWKKVVSAVSLKHLTQSATHQYFTRQRNYWNPNNYLKTIILELPHVIIDVKDTIIVLLLLLPHTYGTYRSILYGQWKCIRLTWPKLFTVAIIICFICFVCGSLVIELSCVPLQNWHTLRLNRVYSWQHVTLCTIFCITLLRSMPSFSGQDTLHQWHVLFTFIYLLYLSTHHPQDGSRSSSHPQWTTIYFFVNFSHSTTLTIVTTL